MIKCNGHMIGPAATLDWEKEVEGDGFHTGWWKVGYEGDKEWDLV